MDARFWFSFALALLIAGVAAFPVIRWLISRGRGHAVVHKYHADTHASHHQNGIGKYGG